MAVHEKQTGTDIKGFFQKIMQNDKITKIIIAIGIIGIILIYISGFFKNNGSNKSSTASSTPVSLTADQYVTQLENNLTSIVNNIFGVTNAKVLITLEKSTQYVYATEEKRSTQNAQDQSVSAATKSQQNNTTETNYILVKDSDGSQKALAVTEVQPVVKGVVVVCTGGDNPIVQQDVINAVTTALDISSARVCVIKAK